MGHWAWVIVCCGGERAVIVWIHSAQNNSDVKSSLANITQLVGTDELSALEQIVAVQQIVADLDELERNVDVLSNITGPLWYGQSLITVL